jgi:serine/threonine protein kinase
MSVPSSALEFVDILKKSGVVDPKRLDAFLTGPHENPLPTTSTAFADLLIREGLITRFQARNLLKGKWRLVLCGKYTILEPLGSGGMGNVFLCAHKIMKRFVAIKVLATEQATEPAGLERFHREARAVAQLRHPNIAVAHDVDQDPPFHFLVMEFIDGTSLQQLSKLTGPMEPTRAAHYIHQAALGLQHAHEAGLVHRDVKPGNLIVDREGTLKVLDLGLARFFHDQTDELTKRHEAGTVLGTADYLAPEQVLDSHNAFPRADIYSLGLTFYFLLAGKSATQDMSVAQKLLWHQMRQPQPLAEVRKDLPKGIIDIVTKMIAKNPDDRYQTMAEVAEALSPWTQTPIAPPSETELPHTAILRHFDASDVGSAPSTRPTGPSSRPPAPARTAPVQTATKKAAQPIQAEMETEDGVPSTAIRIRKDRSDAPTEITPRKEKTDAAVRPKSRKEAKPSRSARSRKSNRKIWLWAGGGVVALALVMFGIVMALRPASPKSVAGTPTTPSKSLDSGTVPAPANQPSHPTQPVVAPQDDQVSIKTGLDSYQIRTPKYEASIDKVDGCLSSLRVGDVEFLKNGGSLANGKTQARGAYFYSEKDGNQGLVKLPEIKQESPNTIVATGGKFSVRYEFKPDSLNIIALNSSDDTVPYYLIFDSTSIHDVINEKGEQLAVPVSMTQRDALDAKWRSTSWIADRARVKVTDRTDNATTRIWGPWSEFNSQVWEGDALTYNRCQVTLEPSVIPESEKPTLKPGGVLITRDGAARKIETEVYEAKVDVDGCMPSLRVDGVEVLRANIDVSRGVYFLPSQPVRLSDIKQPTPTTITAQCPLASIKYEFAHDKMSWTVENTWNQGMPFFVVFDTSVEAIRDGNNEWSKAPTQRSPGGPNDPKCSTVTLFAGRVKLKMTGGSKMWGPWQDKYQVWEASLAPKEKRVITVEMGPIDESEATKLAQITGNKPSPASDLTLYSPLNYQVFQRRTLQQGSMAIRGRVRAEYDRLEIRKQGVALSGALNSDWEEIALKDKARTFEASVETPAGGWYKVAVRALKNGKVVGETSVDHVGIGEVFVGAGQSNSTNCGQERIKQYSGMVSSFSGTNWQIADDPQPGVHDNTAGGSYWPAFGDEMFAKYHVPIGIASTGHSGTSVNQWAPGGELFRWTTGRMKELGKQGFRAVLWHQGESDVSMTAEEYARKMTALIQESRRTAGWEAPWFVAQVSYHNPGQTSFPTTRAGQKKLWETGVAYEGPDTDTLIGDNRDDAGKGIHFSPKGLKAHGKMWAEKVAIYLDKELLR